VLWVKTHDPLTSVDRRGRLESGRRKQESATCVVHRSDYRGDDCQLDVLRKHTLSDDPRLAVVAFGPEPPVHDRQLTGGTSAVISFRSVISGQRPAQLDPEQPFRRISIGVQWTIMTCSVMTLSTLFAKARPTWSESDHSGTAGLRD